MEAAFISLGVNMSKQQVLMFRLSVALQIVPKCDEVSLIVRIFIHFLVRRLASSILFYLLNFLPFDARYLQIATTFNVTNMYQFQLQN